MRVLDLPQKVMTWRSTGRRSTALRGCCCPMARRSSALISAGTGRTTSISTTSKTTSPRLFPTTWPTLHHQGRQPSSDSIQRRRCVARLCTAQGASEQDRTEDRAVVPFPAAGMGRPPVPSQQRVQAKPSRPRLHLLLLLHLLTARVLVLQRGRTAKLLHLRKRRRGMTRAVALNDGQADSSTPLPAYLLPVDLLTFENNLVS